MKLPRTAMPVVRILRREVERPPKSTLRMIHGDEGESPRFLGQLCPMGLLPTTETMTPVYASEFRANVSDIAVASFAAWWDELTLAEAKAAIDLIWPQ